MKTPFLCGALLLVSTLATAQTPQWTVVVTPTLNPLPLGMCGAVHLTLYDPVTKDVPRNPQGYRITMAAFDMSVSGTSAAGQNIDPSHYKVCGCQGGASGSTATVTATYPAQSLPATSRVPNVSFEKTATFAFAPPKGTVNPPPCVQNAAAPTSQSTPNPPQGSSPPAANAPATTPAAAPVPVNPSGARAQVTGPAPNVPRAPGEVLLSWYEVGGASFYVVFGPGLTAGGQRVDLDSRAPFILNPDTMYYEYRVIVVAKNVPEGPQEWLVASYYPGNLSTTADKFTKVQWNMTNPAPPMTPPLTGTQRTP